MGCGMSAAQHTPAPWLPDATKAQVVVPGVDAPICALLWPTELRTEDETLANAFLIAAAPEMLAVLQKLRRGDLHQRVRPIYDEAQAAIAKATGATA